MESEIFSALEIDAIGEILNISLGASATAVSTMLNTRVDITTPQVSVVSREEFEMNRIEPAIGVEIAYVEGLEGSNVILLKKHDAKIIVEMLMGIDPSSVPDEEFELNDINISAVCEVMNQMMGASSTALSEFLGRTVNISTPVSFEIANKQAFIDKYFNDNDKKVVVAINIKIEGMLESEFFHVMPVELAKELLSGFLPKEAIKPYKPLDKEGPEPAGSGGALPGEETPDLGEAAPKEAAVLNGEAALKETAAPKESMAQNDAAKVSAAKEPAAKGSQTLAQPAADTGNTLQMQMMSQMMQLQENIAKTQQELQKLRQAPAPEPKMINVQPAAQPNLNEDGATAQVQEGNLELIMGVPLDVSVEIGRTKKFVRDILEFTKGSLIVLDKLAGEQVDLYVNGQCIAKGDVVVVEDNFGIRITEIVKTDIHIPE